MMSDMGVRQVGQVACEDRARRASWYLWLQVTQNTGCPQGTLMVATALMAHTHSSTPPFFSSLSGGRAGSFGSGGGTLRSPVLCAWPNLPAARDGLPLWAGSSSPRLIKSTRRMTSSRCSWTGATAATSSLLRSGPPQVWESSRRRASCGSNSASSISEDSELRKRTSESSSE